MEYVIGTIVFLFGGALGSFILVIADRHNTGLSFFKGRSFCFSCNTQLSRNDLFPIFSFVFLKGRCRYCESKIPNGAILTEIAMGLLAVLAAFKSGFFGFDFPIIHNSYFVIQNLPSFMLLLCIFGTVLLITIYDLRHFIIPDSFLISLFVLSLLSIILNSYPIIHSLLSGLILTIPFLLIFLVSRGRWLGFGDVKYIAVIGFLLGLSQGISAVILSFWIGAAFSVIALSIKKIIPRISLPLLRNNLTIKSEIPFGPFLSLGIIVSFYFNMDLFHLNELSNIF